MLLEIIAPNIWRKKRGIFLSSVVKHRYLLDLSEQVNYVNQAVSKPYREGKCQKTVFKFFAKILQQSAVKNKSEIIQM